MQLVSISLFRLYVGAPLSNSSGDGRGALFFCKVDLLKDNLEIEKVDYVYEGEFFCHNWFVFND